MTSATGRRPSENVVWAWRLPFRSGMERSLTASSAGSGGGCDGWLPLGPAPRDSEAEAQPSGLPHVRRPVLRHHANRRAPPGEPHPAGRRLLREGLDEGGVVVDDGVTAVDIRILGTRDLAALGLGADDLELGRSRGRRLDLDARLRHGRPRGPQRQRDNHYDARRSPEHILMLSDMAETRKENSQAAKAGALRLPGRDLSQAGRGPGADPDPGRAPYRGLHPRAQPRGAAAEDAPRCRGTSRSPRRAQWAYRGPRAGSPRAPRALCRQ